MVLVPGVLNGLGQTTQSLPLVIVGGVISFVIWVYLQFWPGTDGMNRFGYRP